MQMVVGWGEPEALQGGSRIVTGLEAASCLTDTPNTVTTISHYQK
jgi:hypothetical protein